MTDTPPTIDERREIAREALDVPDGGELGPATGDPYWLKNLHGTVDTDDMEHMAERLHDDAAMIDTAAGLIDSGTLTAEEAALWLADRVYFGGYETDDHRYDTIPITR